MDMTSLRPTHARTTHMDFGALSSGLPVPGAQAAPCVLAQLVPVRRRAHAGRREAMS